jgi:hypothetical protein
MRKDRPMTEEAPLTLSVPGWQAIFQPLPQLLV